MIHKKVETAYVIKYIYEDGFGLYPVSWTILELKGNYSTFKMYGRDLDFFVLSTEHDHPKDIEGITFKDLGIESGYISTTNTYATRSDAIKAAFEYYESRQDAMENILKETTWQITKARTSNYVHRFERERFLKELQENENKTSST